MATTQFLTINFFPADGINTDWQFNFSGVNPDSVSGTTPYLYPADVKAQELYTDALGVPHVIDRVGTLVQPNKFRITGAPVATGRTVKIYRQTEERYPLVDYRDRQTVSEADLDLQARQSLYIAQEVLDEAALATDASAAATVTANSAFDIATEALDTANTADLQSQQAINVAGQATAAAQLAVQQSLAALDAAASAEEHATAVEVLVQDAADSAAAAQAAADVAVTASNEAVIIANGVDAKATAALNAAATANSNANAAVVTANAIDAKATQALSTANSAASAASAAGTAAANAVTTANAVDGKAQAALDAAAGATSVANTAKATADGAKVTADGAAAAVIVNANAIAAVDNRVNATNTAAGLLAGRVTVNESDIAGLKAVNLPALPSWVSPCAHVMSFAIYDGRLYSAQGVPTNFTTWGGGRGGNGVTASFGMDRWQRVNLPSLSKVKRVKTNGNDTWVLLENGELYVCGQNSSGQLGLGHTTTVGVFTLSATGVVEIYGDVSMNANGYASNHIMIRTATDLRGAGYNGYGQLGVGDLLAKSSWTVAWDFAARGAPDLVVHCGTQYGGTFVRVGNRLWATGYNGTGQLGTGNTTQSNTWVEVTSGWGGNAVVLDIVEIKMNCGQGVTTSASGASNATFIRTGAGVLRACGGGVYGVVGTGVSSGNVLTPAVLSIPSPVRQFWMSALQCFAVCTNNRVYAWGYNQTGMLGIGDSVDKLVPTLHPLPFVDKILGDGFDRHFHGYTPLVVFQVRPAAGGAISYMATGGNDYGDRGNGTTATGGNSTSRVQLPSLDKDGLELEITHMSYPCTSYGEMGANHVVVWTKAGSMYTWGYNGLNGAHSAVCPAVSIPMSLPNPFNRGL